MNSPYSSSIDEDYGTAEISSQQQQRKDGSKRRSQVKNACGMYPYSNNVELLHMVHV